MRDIKFRGKRIDNGEWVYGNLVQTTKGCAYILETPSFIPALTLPTEEFIEVYPESVGQYTGLKAKKGKEIYEGDIVRYEGRSYQIVYDSDRSAEFRFNASYTLSNILSKTLQNPFEVIGNMHDNPELLKA